MVISSPCLAQWLNKNAGLLIKAHVMSWAAVSRRVAACWTLISRSWRKLDKRRLGLDRPLGELKLVTQLFQPGIDRQTVPCWR